MRNQHQGGSQDRPVLTIAEAAERCGVSTSTIRRYLAAGRFPAARQQPGAAAGQRGQWWIPTEDLVRAGLARPQAGPDRDADDRVRALEHALEVERTRRQAAEWLAAERAETIRTLERALRALEGHAPPPAGPRPDPGAPAGARPAPQPGMLPMVPRPRRPPRELTQEERAAIIGRALFGQRPPKRRWPWR
jgi:excisionase family DNA binding protein